MNDRTLERHYAAAVEADYCARELRDHRPELLAVRYPKCGYRCEYCSALVPRRIRCDQWCRVLSPREIESVGGAYAVWTFRTCGSEYCAAWARGYTTVRASGFPVAFVPDPRLPGPRA